MAKFNGDWWKNNNKELSKEAKKILKIKDTKYKKYSPTIYFSLPSFKINNIKQLKWIKICFLIYFLLSFTTVLFLLITFFLLPFSYNNSIDKALSNLGNKYFFSIWSSVYAGQKDITASKELLFNIAPLFFIVLFLILIIILANLLFIIVRKKYVFDETLYFFYCIYRRISIWISFSIILLFFMQALSPYFDVKKNEISAIFFIIENATSNSANLIHPTGGIIAYSFVFSIILIWIVFIISKYFFDLNKCVKEFFLANKISSAEKSDLYE